MNRVKEDIIYLSCPYSHQDESQKRLRLKVASEVAFELHQEGRLAFSPLTHNVPLDKISGIPNADWVTWKRFNHEMLSRSDLLMVIQLPGWDISEGVAAEMSLAKELGIPIRFIPCPAEVIAKWEERLAVPV